MNLILIVFLMAGSCPTHLACDYSDGDTGILPVIDGSMTVKAPTDGATGFQPVEFSAARMAADTQIENRKSEIENLRLLVDLALRHNPAIQAARKEWQAATHGPSQAGSLPNPKFKIGSMSDPNPIPFSTIGDGPLSWAQFMFSQEIPWPGKLRVKEEIALTEAQVAAQRYQEVTLNVVRQVKETWFELATVDESLRVLQKYRQLLEQLARIAEARYSVGEAEQQGVLRSQVEISLLLERSELLSSQRKGLAARLNSLLNRSPDVELSNVLPVLDGREVDLPFSLQEMYLKAREQNPAVEAERLQIQRASLALDLARKQLRPDFEVSAGYLIRGGPFPNMYEYGVTVEIPLYSWRKERRGVEENLSEMEASRDHYQQSLQEVTYRIKDAYLTATTSQRLLQLYREGIVPQATAALDSSLAGYQVGRTSFLTMMTDALTILTYELQYQEEVRKYYLSLVRLEELLGQVIV